MSNPYAKPDGRWRYNPPPDWPRPPAGWVPPARWEPDPSWPDPPPGWAVWLPDRRWPARHPGWTAAAAVVLLLLIIGVVTRDPAPARPVTQVAAADGATEAPVTPTEEPTATASATPSPTPSTTRSPAASKRAAPRVPAAPYYANCTEARAAGAAPIRRGEPGYRAGLDADADGVACEAAPTRRTTVAPPPPPAAPPADSGAYYANCSEARAAGAAPIYRGEPGYRTALDRDGDGIACE